jgi:hypothetical protein
MMTRRHATAQGGAVGLLLLGLAATTALCIGIANSGLEGKDQPLWVFVSSKLRT